MSIDEVWREYKRTKNQEIRNKLVLTYLWMVKYMAGRLAIRLPAGMGQEDLESCGMFGLIEAVEKFDPDMGISFETYAYRRIRGSIIDEVRKANWIPRTMWQKLQDLKLAREKLERESGSVSETDVAASMGITVHELRRLESQYQRAFAVSLDESVPVSDGDSVRVGDLVPDVDSPDPLDVVSENESKMLLVKAIKNLPEKEQVILALYYQEGLTLKEIGLVLEVSESRVCQLHGRIVARLKKMLADCLS